MPLGVIINAFSILFGGITGSLVGHKLSPKFKAEITLIFGLCSMGMGISSVVLMKNMPAVIFAIIIGTSIGLFCHLGEWIDRGARMMRKPIAKLFSNQKSELSEEEFMAQLVTIIVLFCASGTGIYGTLTSGMTGDSSILISKSILDFFTAAIFACNLGSVVSFICVPQFIIFLAIFMCAGFIYPLTTPDMIMDFKACGGIIMLGTGFRMIHLKNFPVADMIPAMILVMPLSYIWVTYIVAFVS